MVDNVTAKRLDMQMRTTTPNLPAPIDAVARVLEATERDAASYRCLYLLTLGKLHDAFCTIDTQRQTIAELRDTQRRLAVSLFGEPQ